MTWRPLALVLAALGTAPVIAAAAWPARPSLADVFASPERCALDAAANTYEARVAGHPSDARALKGLGVALHDLAALQVRAAATRAVAALARAHALAPGDPEVVAYLGSA